MKAHLRDVSVVIDVGANAGFYSCLAKSLGKTVVAVEPSRRNLRVLYQNLDENKWKDVEVFPMALAAQPGVASLFGSGVAASLLPGWNRASLFEREFVAVTTLDTLIGGRFQGQAMAIKIDVEGAELEVLKGAAACLRHTPRPVWFIEIIGRGPFSEPFNRNYVETFELFFSTGYRCFTWNKAFREIGLDEVRQWARAGGDVIAGHNFVFREAR